MTNILQSYAPFNLLLDVVEKEQQRYILQEKRKIQENGLEKRLFSGRKPLECPRFLGNANQSSYQVQVMAPIQSVSHNQVIPTVFNEGAPISYRPVSLPSQQLNLNTKIPNKPRVEDGSLMFPTHSNLMHDSFQDRAVMYKSSSNNNKVHQHMDTSILSTKVESDRNSSQEIVEKMKNKCALHFDTKSAPVGESNISTIKSKPKVKKRKQLSKKQASRSTDVKLELDMIRWQERFQELCLYKEVNGDCLVPQHYEENQQLGMWVSNQRRLQSKSKKTPLMVARIKALDSIGFVWNTKLALKGKKIIRRKRINKISDCNPSLGNISDGRGPLKN